MLDWRRAIAPRRFGPVRQALHDAYLFVRRVGRGQVELRHFVAGRKSPLKDEIRRQTQFAYIGDHIGLCRIMGRYKLYVDTQDVGLSSHLMIDGYWELWVTELLVVRLRRGMVAIDVGANLGYFTMIMADLVGAQGRVHAFEPNPVIGGLLKRSTHVNGFHDRVTLHADPLGEHDGQRVMLHVPERYPGGAWIAPAPEEAAEGVMTIRRLDSYPDLLDADVVKIDAEGGEHAIWRGMRGIFARGRPMLVLLEFVLGRYTDAAGFIDEIRAEGFALYYVDGIRSLRPITPAEILRHPPEQDIMLVLIR